MTNLANLATVNAEDLITGTTRPSAIDNARSNVTRQRTARNEVARRLRGVEALFGPEVAESLRRPVEQVHEATSEAFAYFEDALIEAHDAHARALGHAVETHRQLRAELSRYRVALAGAAEAEQTRHKRTPAARRTIAPWFVDAVTNGLLGESPF